MSERLTHAIDEILDFCETAREDLWQLNPAEEIRLRRIVDIDQFRLLMREYESAKLEALAQSVVAKCRAAGGR